MLSAIRFPNALARVRQFWGLAEIAIGVLLAAVFWLPWFASGRAWPLFLLPLVLLSAVDVMRRRRLPSGSVAVLLYLAVFVGAAVHGGSINTDDIARYFIRPLIAVGVASVATAPATRARVLVLIGLFAAFQLPVAAAQTIRNVVTYGRNATSAADAVTGSLGASQAGTLTLVALVPVTLIAAAWIVRAVNWQIATVAASLFLATGVLSSTRAVVPFAVLVGFSLAVGGALMRRRHAELPTSRLAAVAAAALIAAPLLYAGTRVLYPDAFVGAISSQQTTVLGGAAAQGIQTGIIPPPRAPRPRSHEAGKEKPIVPRVAAETGSRGVELLPGRFEQLRIAGRVSVRGGFLVALLGRGPGATMLDPTLTLAQDVPDPQKTGPTWIGRVLVECGWLGLAAFFGLQVWLALLGRSLWRAVPPRSADAVLAVALPGVAALTAAGAVLGTVLDIRAYSIVFWVIVGLALAAAADRRNSFAGGHGDIAGSRFVEG